MQHALFFDLDGTLTDPKPGITRCVQYALERLERPVPEADALVWCIGPPLHDSFAELLGPELAWRGVELYRERYAELGLFENAVYPEIERVLGALRDSGFPLCVASSKPLVFVRQVLDHFDLTRYFEAIFGAELDGRLTDKTELLAHALGTREVEGIHSTMIGDRHHDAIGARENRMAFVGALYGYGSVDEFLGAGATRWVERPEDLLPTLMDSGPSAGT